MNKRNVVSIHIASLYGEYYYVSNRMSYTNEVERSEYRSEGVKMRYL